MHASIPAAFAALLLTAAPIRAQEPQLPPVIAAIDMNETLPADGVFETLGIGLGESVDNVLAALGRISGQEPSARTLLAGLSDNRGNKFQFVYHLSASVDYRDGDQVRQSIEAVFSTNVNEARVVYLHRTLYFSPSAKEGDLTGFMEALTDKYGPVSFRDPQRPGGRLMTLYWVWHDGVRVTMSDEEFQASRYVDGSPARCASFDSAGYAYGMDQREPRCGAVMKVTVHLGTRDDLMGTTHIEMFDNERRNRNLADTHEWADAEFEKVVAAKGGTTPNL